MGEGALSGRLPSHVLSPLPIAWESLSWRFTGEPFWGGQEDRNT